VVALRTDFATWGSETTYASDRGTRYIDEIAFLFLSCRYEAGSPLRSPLMSRPEMWLRKRDASTARRLRCR
jgi:hypothetical protein